MNKKEKRSAMAVLISKLSRDDLERAYLDLMEISLQKTELIEDIGEKLADVKHG